MEGRSRRPSGRAADSIPGTPHHMHKPAQRDGLKGTGKNLGAMEKHPSIIRRINDHFFPKEEEWTAREKFLAVGFWGLPLWLTLLLYPFVNGCSGKETSPDTQQINRGTYYLQEPQTTAPEFKPLPDAAERFEKLLQEGTEGYEEDVYEFLDQYLD